MPLRTPCRPKVLSSARISRRTRSHTASGRGERLGLMKVSGLPNALPCQHLRRCGSSETWIGGSLARLVLRQPRRVRSTGSKSAVCHSLSRPILQQCSNPTTSRTSWKAKLLLERDFFVCPLSISRRCMNLFATAPNEAPCAKKSGDLAFSVCATWKWRRSLRDRAATP